MFIVQLFSATEIVIVFLKTEIGTWMLGKYLWIGFEVIHKSASFDNNLF